MKFLVFIFTLIIICSCVEQSQDKIDELEIRQFTYKGHKYLRFETARSSYAARMGIVHDPDCGCH